MHQNPKITKEILYKIFISIASGLIGFWLSLHPFVFLLPPFKLNFMAGLVCPMIVSLKWGWRYGLLSATLGLGCQTMWLKGGWESIVTVTMFTFWIIWHGWCAERFRNIEKTRWSHYIVEIPFRIFNTIILYTIFGWLSQFNPAPWAPEITKSAVSMPLLNITAIEAAVNGYLVLLLSDALIIYGPLRKVFKLQEIKEQKRTNYIFSAAISIFCLFWVIDGVFSYYIFRDFSFSMFSRCRSSADPQPLRCAVVATYAWRTSATSPRSCMPATPMRSSPRQAPQKTTPCAISLSSSAAAM